MTFADETGPRYGIGVMPASARWGTRASGRHQDIDEYLCTKNRPVVLWLVGTVHFIQLEAAKDSYVVTIEPLSGEHLATARKVQYGRASPPVGKSFVI